VLCGDNVQREVSFICHCCGCCCGILAGISKHGYTNVAATSSFIARSDDATCKGCNHCEKACPIDAIQMVPLACGSAGGAATPLRWQRDDNPNRNRKKRPVIEQEICLGCGVCVVKCRTGAMKLDPRPQRVIPPESTFRRVLLMALDRGTLQNMIFTHPELRTHRYLRVLVGGFLQLKPVKRSLMSTQLRSRFLRLMELGAKAQGRGWITTDI
jgi:ferredoxin